MNQAINQKVNQESYNFYDNVLMMALNEKAFKTGLIDEKTKTRINKELQVNGQKAKNTC